MLRPPVGRNGTDPHPPWRPDGQRLPLALVHLRHVRLRRSGRVAAGPLPGSVRSRPVLPLPESVAYVVCARNKLVSKSEKYLSNYVDRNDKIDVYQVMRAAGQVEGLLGLTPHTTFEKTKAKPVE